MRKVECEFLKKKFHKFITETQLFPYLEDRTLLYGVDQENNFHHTYIKNGTIRTITYKLDETYNLEKESLREIIPVQNDDYVSNIVLYPECCDYEFCKLLKEQNSDMKFDQFNEKRPKHKYYGFVL